jgi:hypothetical protein
MIFPKAYIHYAPVTALRGSPFPGNFAILQFHSLELVLRVTLTHTLAPAAATLYRTHHTVNETRARPLLVREHVATNFLLTTLHQVHVSEHTLVLECA